MLIAIVATLFSPNIQEYYWIIGTIAAGAVVGTLMAIRVKITALPQMVAILMDLEAWLRFHRYC